MAYPYRERFCVRAAMAQAGHVKAYVVWDEDPGDGEPFRIVHRFPCRAGKGWKIALHLANKMRDDLNEGID